MENYKKSGKNKDKLRTKYSKNHDNFKNSTLITGSGIAIESGGLSIGGEFKLSALYVDENQPRHTYLRSFYL